MNLFHWLRVRHDVGACRRLPLCLFCAVLLVGCTLTDPQYLGAEVTRVQIDESVFDVRQRGDTAMALRLNPEPPAAYQVAMTRAVIAIEVATGCLVLRAGGDAQDARARLDCGPEARLRQQPLSYDCDAFEIFDGVFEVRCRPGI